MIHPLNAPLSAQNFSDSLNTVVEQRSNVQTGAVSQATPSWTNSANNSNATTSSSTASMQASNQPVNNSYPSSSSVSSQSSASSSSSQNRTVDERLTNLENQLVGYGQIGLFERIDELETELQMLRGQIEEQQRALELMQRRQRDLYLDLDRRFEEGGSSATNATSAANSVSGSSSAKPSAAQSSEEAIVLGTPVISPELTQEVAEQEAYQKAYGFVRDQQYPAATEAFQSFVKTYPNSTYTPNAYYWLGELYLVQGNDSEAEKTFNHVLTAYPSHAKAADALLKIGLIEYTRLEWSKAEKVFREVIQRYPNTSTANIAEARLQEIKQKATP